MQAAFTDEQDQLRDLVTRFLRDNAGPLAARRLMAEPTGYDPAVWQRLCQELGLASTHIPARYGGFGFGPIELGIAMEEMGRHLYCGPFFASSVMAAGTLLAIDAQATNDKLLPGIASGETLATLVLDSLDQPSQLGRHLSFAAGKVSGVAGLVLDAGIADLLLLVAQTKSGLALLCTQRQAPTIAITQLETIDSTRKIYRVEFTKTPAEHLADLSPQSLQAAWRYISVALAHEMIGGAQHLLETTVEYTKMRYQFGRPIGSFQGLKHRCADLLMEVELAKAATHHAARCLAADQGEAYAPHMAKALAADAYMKAAKEAIQLRGGIGFTWEEDTHLWYKRAKSSEVLMGTPAMHRELMMTLLED